VLDWWSYDWKTADERLESRDFYELAIGGGKLSIDVNTFNSLSYFYILNLLFLVDFAFSDDLLFNISYRIILPNEGK